MVASDISAGAGAGDSFQSASGSEPIQWLQSNMNPLTWQFLGEPAWKWAVFLVAMSLFLAAWAGVHRYMK